MIEIIVAILMILLVCFGVVCFFGAPFVPTRRVWAEQALDLAKLRQSDLVVDLGSGSGTILKLVAQRGARAVGYEINPILYLWSRLATARYAALVKLRLSNFWRSDLPSETTVVYVFAVMRDAKKLEVYFQNQAQKIAAPHLKVITFGCWLPDIKPAKKSQGAALYVF
jgi:SAM-dependent methyltransferase